jgi:hypothetical protein
MEEKIVSGLFGIDPQQLMRQRQATDAANAFRFAQLDPLERANMAIYQGSAGLARGVSGLLGGDPELEKVSRLQQIGSQFDFTKPQGLREFGRAIQPFAPNESMMAIARADEMEKSGLGLQKTRADMAKAELSAANEEKLRGELAALGPNATDQQVIAVVQKYGSPDKILQVLSRKQEREDALAARRATAGEKPAKPLSSALQKSEDADLLKIDNLTAQSDALGPSIKNLTKDEKGVRALDLNPAKIATYTAQNFIGNSTEESRRYAALKSAVDTAVNLQVSAEKGVQTDRDVLRFANALIAAYGRFDSEATLEALKNYNAAVLTAKNKTQGIIQSRRKQQKVEPYEFASTDNAAPPTKEVDFSTLPKRKTP